MAARSRGVGVCASALLALIAHGCVDDGVSAHVICPIPPETEGEGGACTWDTEGDVCLLEGVLNLLATDRYAQVLRIESGLKARVREVPPLGETNRVQFNRAKVELRSANGARFLFEDAGPNPYYVNATGFVVPEGIGSVSATLISPSYARELNKLFTEPNVTSAQIVLAITLKGVTDGDTEVSSAEFLWPVRVFRASVNPADPASRCVEGQPVCASNFGQDAFANSCLPE